MIETYNLPVFLLVTPMFLFSGTFFPLDNLPAWARAVAMTLPLTHLTDASRTTGLGYGGSGLPLNLLCLALYIAVFYPLALVFMRRRLIK